MTTELSDEDRAIARSYLADPKTAIRQQRRIALGYGLGCGMFMLAALWLESAWLALPVYGVFLIWLFLRARAFERRARALHRILSTYVNDTP